MDKAINIIRKISDWILILLFVIILGFFIFQEYKDIVTVTIPLPISIEIQRNYTNIVIVSLIVLIPLTLLSNLPEILRFVLFMFLVPICCFFLFISPSFIEEVIASYELKSQNYHISVKWAIDAPIVTYTIYECDTDNLRCQRIYTDPYHSVEDLSFYKDEGNSQLYIFRNHKLFFVTGNLKYEITTSEQFGEFTYYIGRHRTKFFLFKCKINSLDCQQLPFQYININAEFRFVFDEDTNEFKLYRWNYNEIEDILLYSYGEEVICYVPECSVSKE